MLTPPAVSLPLPRWTQGPLSVPCRLDTPAYRLESNTRKTYCHMPYNAGCCLPVREGSDTATCHATLDPTSLLGRAPMLPRVPWLWILPPCLGGLWRCHMSCCSRSCLPTQEGTGAAMCPATLDPASLLGRAPALPQYRDAWHLSHHGPQDVRTGCYNAPPAQLTTLGYDYSDDATRQGNTTPLTLFSTTVRQDGMTPYDWRRTRHHLLLLSINTLDAVIGFQPHRGHRSGPGSSCNCPILCYKRTGRPPNLGKLFLDSLRQVQLTAIQHIDSTVDVGPNHVNPHLHRVPP
jgi:hypothetical protein